MGGAARRAIRKAQRDTQKWRFRADVARRQALGHVLWAACCALCRLQSKVERPATPDGRHWSIQTMLQRRIVLHAGRIMFVASI